MNVEQIAFDQIGKTLGRLFYSMYYIDIAYGSFCEFSVSHDVINIVSSNQEIDFFTFLNERAQQYIHPEDLTRILHAFERENLLKVLSENTTYITDCRLICEIYKHSPVFRIGGDEFAVVLTGRDYEQRENLLQDLKNETMIKESCRATFRSRGSSPFIYLSILTMPCHTLFERV